MIFYAILCYFKRLIHLLLEQSRRILYNFRLEWHKAYIAINVTYPTLNPLGLHIGYDTFIDKTLRYTNKCNTSRTTACFQRLDSDN